MEAMELGRFTASYYGKRGRLRPFDLALRLKGAKGVSVTGCVMSNFERTVSHTIQIRIRSWLPVSPRLL